jgi:ribosomal protein S18 acetylase RimI-like enzyme
LSSLRFRRASRSDDAFFRQVELQTTWESLRPADQERLGQATVREALSVTHELLLQRPGTEVVIAEDEAGERVGLLWFGVNRNLVTGEDEAWIYNISVLPEHQGKGYGKQIMSHAEELARRGGFSVIGLMVSSHNERAQRLYEAFAYEPTNLLMRKRLG